MRLTTRSVFALVLLCSGLWAGKEFTPKPGDDVAADQLIVRLVPGANIQGVVAALPAGATAKDVLPAQNVHLVKLPAGVRDAVSHALANNPSVDYVEANYIRHSNAVGTPNDPGYSQQWALQTVQALSAWNLIPDLYLTASNSGSGRIKVAVLDSGADCTHPDFMNAGGTSADAAAGGQISFANSSALVATTVSSPSCPWQDDNGHGTHTAGTIAAATQNGAGVASVAYPVQLLIYKVLDSSGSGADTTIAQAIQSAADAGARVVSLSLGGAGYSQTLQNAVLYAWKRNTLVVAAAGNDNSNELFFPAAANYVIAVAATDSSNAKASFSNWGNAVDIAAPGVSVLSTMPTYPNTIGVQNYAYMSGTSMATPHVAAVAGLIALTTPNVAAAAIAQRLQRSAASGDSSGGWNPNTGYGIVNAYNAVSGTLRPASVGGVVGQVVDASGYPIGSATVSINGQSFTTGADGLFRFANLTPAMYVLTASASGRASVSVRPVVVGGADTTIPVQMGVSQGEFTGVVTDAGLPVADAAVQAVSGGLAVLTTVTGSDGRYSLTVPAGTYDLRASAVGFGSATVYSQYVGTGLNTISNIVISRLGWITGTVKNSSLSPVAGAQVTISGPTSAGAVTDGNGNFQSIGLASGSYTVLATASGQPDTSVSGVTVNADMATALTIQMGGTAPPPPPPPTGFSPIRVNAGGGAYTDSSGNLWNTDTGAAGGNTWSTGASISNTSTPALYQTCRYGVFSYNFSVPNGSYTVRLKFAEVSQTAVGQRVFNVAINGTAVLSNFDVFAAAGGMNIALDRSFPVSVGGGQISIQFNNGPANSPLVNAIEIVQSAASTPVSVSPSSVTLGQGGSQQFTANVAVSWSLSPWVGNITSAGVYTAPASISSAQNVTVIATSTQDSSQTGTAVVSLTPPATGTFTPIRVNAGGSGYTDPAGNTWSADTGANGGNPWSTGANISNTNTPQLYQTCRYGVFAYSFAVPSGTYTVNLKFAEVSQTSVGQRVFNVGINGSTVLANFDVFAAAGGMNIAVDRSFTVNATGGQIAIQFDNGPANSPLINAIEIVQGSAPPQSAVRVNAGGPAYTDPSGNTWSADTGANGGNPWSTGANISSTNTPQLYQTCRYGEFAYTIAVPNGNYTVNLKFAEVSQTAAGQRVFNVAINETPVLQNFDIFAQSGGMYIALDKAFPISVSNGQIVVQFTNGPANSPLVNAIEVVSR